MEKIRRLYDIANVFSVLGLIKKISLESKKPAYQWVGLQGLDAFIAELHASQCEVDPARKFKEENSLFFPSQRNLEVNNNEEDGRLNKNPKDQMLENFFVMLLQFCRLELQSQTESLSSTSDLSIETLRIQDSESSSGKLGVGKDTKKEYINSARVRKLWLCLIDNN